MSIFKNALLFILTAVGALSFGEQASAAVELQTSFLPSYLYRLGGVAVLRADTTLLIGGDYFWIGPYALYEGVDPQATDTSYGAAIRIGHDEYFEIDAGYFQRVFAQTGSLALTGTGYSGSLVYGWHLSPHLGVSLAATAKRISSGTLEKRTTIDLLPLFSMRVEF